MPQRKLETVILKREDFGGLLESLHHRGFFIIGPSPKDGAIVYGEIDRVEDLPVGLSDIQGAGIYRITAFDDLALFGYVLGPHTWKRFLFPPRTLLWRGRRASSGFDIEEPGEKPPAYAFLGVRPCELAALSVQDRVFVAGDYADHGYREVRSRALIIAVNCTRPGGTCFCASMGTGPEATGGYDLLLTEVQNRDRHYFAVRAGSDRGEDVLRSLRTHPATDEELSTAQALLSTAAGQMGRRMERDGVRELLRDHPESTCWDDVASRCLGCANCTLVCPTCFCSTVEDTTDLTGAVAERRRRWDSCFHVDFTYIHGGSIRTSGRARYRQWLTHKLSSWHDQYGVSGCVGCGRCITWCPAGIDLTDEIRCLRQGLRQAST